MNNLIALIAISAFAGIGVAYRSGFAVGICVGVAYILGVQHG